MRRNRRPSLRGSVTQTTSKVRVRETPRFGVLTRITIASAIVVIVILLVLWGWKSGWLRQEAMQIADESIIFSQKAHFAVNDIVVEGRQHTDKDQLYAALGTASDSPIFSFSPALAESRISKLPWVESVTVERRLPNTIYVHLTERTALARWQHDNQISVVDTEGKVLPDTNSDTFRQLPLLVGASAAAEAKTFLDTLHTFPPVERNMTAAVRVSERRWDIHLQPNIVAKLPERELTDALKRLSILITEQKILERDIVAIDLRIPDRLIIESPPTAPEHPPVSDHL